MFQFRLWLPIRLCASALVVFIATSATAQTTSPQQEGISTPSSGRKMVSLSGELGTFGELYSISGRENRRPGETGRLFFRPTITFWDNFSLRFDFMLSTEGSSARQDINQIDINPRWSWGEAHAGDFYHEFTPLTLSGVKIRGGGVMLTPGKLRFSLFSGLTQRSVDSFDKNRSYERLISGGKLGYGEDNGTYFDLLFVTSRDNLASVTDSVVIDTVTDTLFGDTTLNPLAVTPQENLLLALVSNVVLADSKVTWRSEFSGSALTRDRRSSELEAEDVPQFLKDLFTPRVSSSFDYAYSSEISYDNRTVGVSAGYQYIGPGYVSLGVASLMSDRQVMSLGFQYRFRIGMFKIDGSHENDNLIDQKSYTTDRNRLTALTNLRLSKKWNSNLVLAVNTMSNDSPVDQSAVDFSSVLIRTSQRYAFGKSSGFKDVTVDYSLQSSKDSNPLRENSKLRSHSGGIRTTYALRKNLDLIPAINVISSSQGTGSAVLTSTYSLSARHVAMNRRLRTDGTIRTSLVEGNSSWRTSMKSAYQFTSLLTATGEIELQNFRGDETSGDFDEIALRLTIIRRF